MSYERPADGSRSHIGLAAFEVNRLDDAAGALATQFALYCKLEGGNQVTEVPS
jgi:hypothetical protein